MAIVFRAVSVEEYEPIVATGRFEIVPGGCEGKHFADTLAGAREFGKALYGAGRFKAIEADVPSLFQWADLDGCGPARFLAIADLENVRPQPVIE